MKTKVFCFKMNYFPGSSVFIHKKRSPGSIFPLEQFESCDEQSLRFSPVILSASEEKGCKGNDVFPLCHLLLCHKPTPRLNGFKGHQPFILLTDLQFRRGLGWTAHSLHLT